MKTFIIFLALFVAVTANAQKTLKTDSVYLTGKVGKFEAYKEKANSLRIIINDLAFGKQLTYLGKINNDGTYSLSFIKTSTQDVMLLYNEQLGLIIVKPGDHIQVNFNADDLANSMTFAGDGAQFNREIKTYVQAKQNDPGLGYKGQRLERFSIINKSEKENEPETHKKLLADIYAKETLFLTNYLKQHKVNEITKSWATIDLKYEYLNNLMRYAWLHPYYNKLQEDSFKVPDSYFDFINQTDLDNTEGAMSSNYGAYVFEYGRHIASKAFGRLYNVDNQIELFLKQPAGLGRDVILSNLLYNLTQSGALDLVKTYLDKYKAAVQQPQFKAKVVKAYDDKVYQLNNYKLPAAAQINNVPKTAADSLFSKILAKYAGKVVYVDFWATWCGPCRAEMPNSKELHKKLDGKDVVFLYLGVQSEEKVWKASIAEMGIEGEHFLLNNNDFNTISAKFQISGIPRYLLVDKMGRVYDSNAKRPGDGNLKQDIEKLLAAK